MLVCVIQGCCDELGEVFPENAYRVSSSFRLRAYLQRMIKMILLFQIHWVQYLITTQSMVGVGDAKVTLEIARLNVPQKSLTARLLS